MKKTFIFLSAFIIINCTYANTFIDIYADYPTVQANNIIFYFVQPGQISIGWTKGNGSSKIVFVSQGDTGIARPIDGTTYFADHQFGNGSQIGASGWYCIHKSPNSISSYYRDTITGLKPNTIYRVMVLEYNGGEGEEKYLRSTAQDNPMSQSTQPGIAGFIEDRYLDNVRSSCFSYIRNIISDGGKPIISHGLCWAAHHEPALADNIHINGTDVGAFKSCIGYLEPNTTYYVRSFLIYPDDTVYGNEFSIHTKASKLL